MTDELEEGAAGRDAAGAASRRPQRAGVRAEALLALEVAALASFVFSRPVLDSFGRSPETFIARGGDTRTVVVFGILVAFVPALALTAAGLTARLLGARARRLVHLSLLASLAGVAGWQLTQDLTGLRGASRQAVTVTAAALAALALVAARRRLSIARTFLRVAGAASLVYLLQFLFLSPASDLVLGRDAGLDEAVQAEVAAALDDEPPLVVVLVFDAFPTMSLLDGQGAIDAELYPNLAELAATSTWYRDHTTVAAFTTEAVPAILTGRMPEPGQSNDPRPDRENLFTLLEGAYDIDAREVVTRLCPPRRCAVEASGALGNLVGDAVSLWSAGTDPADVDATGELPGVLDSERVRDARRWIEDQDFERRGRPTLHFYHALLPHNPWEFTPDGIRYEQVDEIPFGFFLGWGDQGTGAAVGRQRHLLQVQLVDRLVGQVMEELEAAGTFDDALIVVTADHGEAFSPGEPFRALSAGNVPEIAWVPLIIKEPGQTEGVVDDRNVLAIDILPTIADVLGVQLPWSVDGLVLGQPTGREPDRKPFHDRDLNHLRADDGDDWVYLDTESARAQLLAANPVEGEGADGIWRRTRHGDLFARPTEGLATGAPVDEAVTVARLDDLETFDPDEPPLLEVVGATGLEVGAVVAYALSGTVAALTEVEPAPDGRVAHALLPPELLVAGQNELTAFVVEGDPGRETLHPLTVE